MLDTAHVNSKVVWCMKEKIDFHKLSSYDFVSCNTSRSTKKHKLSWNDGTVEKEVISGYNLD